jgi:putative Mg2+ transporter-C (MgtC) family protein
MGNYGLSVGEMMLRAVMALLCGAIIGLNRDLHHKGAGFRTFSLVALGTTGITIGMLMSLEPHPDNVGRVAQGVLTGIGFLGAGVILRGPDGVHVTGLTTAAAIWFVAGLALLCGLGYLLLVTVLLTLALMVLVGGGALERAVERRFGARIAGTAEEPPDETG